MRAAVCRSYGPPEVVQIEDLPSPPLDAGQIRVRVSAAAVNFPDVLIVANEYQIRLPTPFVPGSEFAGVGRGGRPAASPSRPSGTASSEPGSRVRSPRKWSSPPRRVTRIPDGVDDRLAAAFGVAHRTAYHVLRSVAAVQPGEELIVLGAGGGVGLAAVQLGVRARGDGDRRRVVGREARGRRVVRRPASRRPPGGRPAPGAPRHAARPAPTSSSTRSVATSPSPRCARSDSGGRFVTVGYASGDHPAHPAQPRTAEGHRRSSASSSSASPRTTPTRPNATSSELLELLATGRVVPHIGAAFALDDAAAALRYVADGRAIGKVVVDVAPSSGGRK